MFKLLHYDGKNGEILHEVEKLFLCVCFSVSLKVMWILFHSWVVEFQDVVDFESSRFIFEVDQWLKTDDHMMTQDICYYN